MDPARFAGGLPVDDSKVEDGAIKKVIVIGLDGLDPRIVTRLLESAQLLTWPMLKEQGGFRGVATTRPAQTPWPGLRLPRVRTQAVMASSISWKSQNYLPELALNRYEQKNAFLPPKAVNLRRGVPLWDLLAVAGKNATVLRCPCTYPADRMRGQMLSGVGVPDLRGGFGTSTFYTSSDSATAARLNRWFDQLKCSGYFHYIPDRPAPSQRGWRPSLRRYP